MADKIITLKDENSNNLYPTSSYNAIKDSNGLTLPDDFNNLGSTKGSATVNNYTSYWTKFSNGILIQCGERRGSDVWNNSKLAITFSQAFKSGTTPRVIITPISSADKGISTNISVISNTGFTGSAFGVTTSDKSQGFYWVAMGLWK